MSDLEHLEEMWRVARPDASGLVPCVVQDVRSRAVLMVAWANRDALFATFASGRATFWSRSRGELWEKGLSSGNRQRVVHVRLDCDGDTLLYLVEPSGPACHEGTDTCFSRVREGHGWRYDPQRVLDPAGIFARTYLGDVERMVDATRGGPEGLDRLAASVKEGAEGLAHAVTAQSPEAVREAAAQLLLDLALTLRQRGVAFDAVWAALKARASDAK